MRLYHVSKISGLKCLRPFAPVSNVERPTGVYLSDLAHICYWAAILDYWRTGFCLYEVDIDESADCFCGGDNFTDGLYSAMTVGEAMNHSHTDYCNGFEIVIKESVACRECGTNDTILPLLNELVRNYKKEIEQESKCSYWDKRR